MAEEADQDVEEVGRNSSIRPLSLQQTASAVARNYSDKGAVVITFGDEGVRVGVNGLTPDELREALCVAVHYSFVFEEC